MPRRLNYYLRLLAAAFLALPSAWATPTNPSSAPAALLLYQEFNFTLEGKITRKEPGRLTVSAEQNIIFRVRYDEKTEIRQADGSAGSEKDLRLGAVVRVEGDLTESGEIVALRIEIQPSRSPTK